MNQVNDQVNDKDVVLESPAEKLKVDVPRHWLGPEELNEDFWVKAKHSESHFQEFPQRPIDVLNSLKIGNSTESNSQSFMDVLSGSKVDIAVGSAANVDATIKKEDWGLARRDFLTVMGASIAMGSLSCAQRPVNKIIPYVIKPEEITPGVSTYYASTCQECSVGCGILAKNKEGRPIKLEGNPDHPISAGALCARGQASLLNLYDPERLKGPIVRVRGSEFGTPIGWAEVDSQISSRLSAIAARGGNIRILTKEIKSPASQELLGDFLSYFNKGKHIQYEPLAFEEIAEGQAQSYGTDLIPSFRFDKAEYVLSLAADFLGTWVSPVEHAAAWSKMRKLDSKMRSQAKLSKLVCFESHLSLTGSNADERYTIRPGEEYKVALTLAHELVVQQKKSRFADDPAVISALRPYHPVKVAAEIGIDKQDASKLVQIANKLWEYRKRGLVVAGGIASKTPRYLALQVATNFLNSLLENEGFTIDGSQNYGVQKSQFADLQSLVTEINQGKIEALILVRSNPVYYMAPLKISELLNKVPLVIAIGDREDETAKLADFVLPDHHFLENWGDYNPSHGIFSLQQPVVAPLFSTRAFEDTLIRWAQSLGREPDKAMKSRLLKAAEWSGFGIAFREENGIKECKDWHGYLQNHWKELHFKPFKPFSQTASFQGFWESILREGVYDARNQLGISSEKIQVRPFKIASLNMIPKSPAAASDSMQLVLYAKISQNDGRSANNAWLQEMPDPISTVTWDNYINIAPSTADRLGIAQDDVLEVQLDAQSFELPVNIQPGMHPMVISVAVGYGRTGAGKVGNIGVNAFALASAEARAVHSSGHSVRIRKTAKRYALARTQWASHLDHRPIINDITFKQFQDNPATANHTDPHLRLDPVPTLWPAHTFKGNRWGMAIDLNSCTGCGACVIACQAENNIPVVGRDQVRNSRHMQWIRIDRYYSGTNSDKPDVVFQPMLCQHCENAPCETVCPVIATVHDSEGLNVQVYNRCVGTRYCQNNCPYKVRRFNFFDHWKEYEGTKNLVWNPDVTVRTRGIMEKCTFCVQRIREAKDLAKDRDSVVEEEDLKTACQQTCPTEAIIFGNLNDPKSKVSQLSSDQRSFRVLEVLNTRPAISYLSKVRNKDMVHGSQNPAGAHHG